MQTDEDQPAITTKEISARTARPFVEGEASLWRAIMSELSRGVWSRAAQMLGRRSKYSSSSFFPPSPSPNCFSDWINSMRSIHLTIL